MEIISSAKSTIVTNFPNFEQKCVHENTVKESVDFALLGFKVGLLAEVNRKSSYVEILQVKDDKAGKLNFRRIRKYTTENLYCVGSPKNDTSEIALGLSNGNIKLFNWMDLNHTGSFPADINRNSVIHLNFNSSNEYLSSVYENGQINIYGLNTKVKLDTVRFDENSILSYFHPTRKFHLAVASYTGSVFLLDTQSKKIVFQSKKCHEAPCKDVHICAAAPHLLYSAGYDCLVNIFDTRKKVSPCQINFKHPLSAITVSSCNSYLCVGNLKGELLSYDLRNYQVPLYSSKVHDSAIVRVSFLTREYKDHSISKMNCSDIPEKLKITKERINITEDCVAHSNDSNRDIGQQNRMNITSKKRRDSLTAYLEIQSQIKSRVDTAEVRIRGRDSFDWETLKARRLSAFYHSPQNQITTSYQSLEGNGSKNLQSNNNSQLRRKTIDILNASGDATSEVNTPTSEGNLIINSIQEEPPSYEGGDIEKTSKLIENNVAINYNAFSNKENNMNFSNKGIEEFMNLSQGKLSTPQKNCCIAENADRNEMCRSRNKELISESSTDNDSNKSGNYKTDNICSREDLRKIISSDVEEMLKNFRSDIEFSIDRAKWNIYTQSFNLWSQQMKKIDEIQIGIECLLKTEPFVHDYTRLQRENCELKEKLKRLQQ